jgi:hypothetical protein
MAVAFLPGTVLGQGDLDIFLTNADGDPANAYEITYAIYFVSPGPPESEVLIGSATRIPLNPNVGEYYASLQVPTNATVGTYRIRWSFKQFASSAVQQVVQEWAVVGAGVVAVPVYSVSQASMIGKLRVLLRDQAPDKFYHFRPPESEGNIGAYSQVFGQIWEDAELLEYLERGLDWWNMFPPTTPDLETIDKLVTEKAVWRTAILWEAISHACFALAMNWTADEFSLVSSTLITVVLPDGREVEITIGELYELHCENGRTL